jgi:transposase
VRRAQLVTFFANLPRCLVGIEACASAHHWARELSKLGHEVKLMSPQFVKPYVKTNKNDARDAEAICEAVRRPNMRFVAIKTVAQQELLMLHRVRQRLVLERTAKANQLRGLLAEFGIVLPQGFPALERGVPEVLADAENGLSDRLRERFSQLFGQLRELCTTVRQWELRHPAWPRPRHRNHLRSLLPTPRAAQSRCERFECHFPAHEARQGVGLDLAHAVLLVRSTSLH